MIAYILLYGVTIWCCCFADGDKIELKRAKKQLKIKSLPPVLILHLKRFRIGSNVTKNSTFVEYPEQLDISRYCTEVSTYAHCVNITRSEKFGTIVHSPNSSFMYVCSFIA